MVWLSDSIDSIDLLPLVILGLPTAIREHLGCAPLSFFLAQRRLLAEFVVGPSNNLHKPTADFHATPFQEVFPSLRHTPTRAALSTTPFVVKYLH